MYNKYPFYRFLITVYLRPYEAVAYKMSISDFSKKIKKIKKIKK